MNRIASTLLLAAVSGCASGPTNYPIAFESVPAGARVFYLIGANEKSAKETYVGQTPCTWQLEGNPDGTFKIQGRAFIYSDFVPPVAVFRAEPAEPGPGLYPQRQVYHSSSGFVGADKIPDKVFFDLRKEPEVK